MQKELTKRVIVSGIQPSGFIHLGNYLGAVQHWVHLQNEDYKRFYSVVDYHSLTTRHVGKDLGEVEVEPTDEIALRQSPINKEEQPESLTLKTAATLLACGIKPEQSCLFVQSHVPAHTEMMWLLSTMTPLSWLNKMIQFKEKKNKQDKFSSLSLYSYPVLMAADILCYQANLVPVGEDQTQHLELARDLGTRYNRMFGQLFPEPHNLPTDESLFVHKRVMSLQNAGKKMSKSDNSRLSCINLIDDAEVIRMKIRKAKTDSQGKITFDRTQRPELANLLSIYAALEGIDPTKVDQLFTEDNMFTFKEKLSNKLIDKVCPIGERALTLCEKEEDYLIEVLDQGAKEAQAVAEGTLASFKQQMGILRRK